MKLIEYRSYFRTALKPFHSIEESDDFLKRLLKFYFDWEPIKIGLEPNYILKKKEEDQLNNALRGLIQQEPLQYITGRTYFLNIELEVNKSVLIPRPETEELVQWVLESESHEKDKSILDIGTGSGCIPISLKQGVPNWRVSAMDVSQKALDVAIKNAKINTVSIEFHLEDILSNELWGNGLDVIVSNPPYVVPSEKEEMQSNVLDYEPELALFVPEDNPLLFYDKIIQFAETNLNENGVLYFEINPIFVEELTSLLKQSFESIEVRNDFLSRPRMIRASKSKIKT